MQRWMNIVMKFFRAFQSFEEFTLIGNVMSVRFGVKTAKSSEGDGIDSEEAKRSPESFL
ncbi:hypothetical protein ABEW61_23055 [Paenibacillus amylolyticus]|uniref:hypothetical protein n=1 Tax=Paenibacillus amylolyticus TaxID=1451 RepID=UPI003D27C0F0